MTLIRLQPDAPLFVSKHPTFTQLKDALQPVDTHLPASEKPRLAGQNAVILARLRQGPVTCTELLAMGVRRGAARIHDIREAGYRVLTTPLKGHDTLYTLMEGGSNAN